MLESFFIPLLGVTLFLAGFLVGTARGRVLERPQTRGALDLYYQSEDKFFKLYNALRVFCASHPELGKELEEKTDWNFSMPLFSTAWRPPVSGDAATPKEVTHEL